MQSDPTTIFFQIIVLVFSIILHELAHGYAAEYFGDKSARLSGRLTLNPIPHIDLFGSIILPLLLVGSGSGIVFGWAKPVPVNPYNLRGRFADTVVSAAGIFSNFLLALIFGLILHFFGNNLPGAFFNLAIYIVLINIVLAIFNLIPIPPLDGSKILLSLLPVHLYEKYNAIERWGFLILLAFIIFVWPYFSPVIYTIFKLLTGIPL